MYHRSQQDVFLIEIPNSRLFADGRRLFAWGLGIYGNLGDGSAQDRLEPITFTLPLTKTLSVKKYKRPWCV